MDGFNFDKERDAEWEAEHCAAVLKDVSEKDPLTYEKARLETRQEVLEKFESINAPIEVVIHQKELIEQSRRRIAELDGTNN